MTRQIKFKLFSENPIMTQRELSLGKVTTYAERKKKKVVYIAFDCSSNLKAIGSHHVSVKNITDV